MVVSQSSRRLLIALTLLGLALLFCPPSASAEGFTAIELPPVPTRLGEFAAIDPTGIDRRGRVVGGASLVEEDSPGVFGYWVGFRFHPRSETSRVIDPSDGLHSDVWRVNKRGLAFGESFVTGPREQVIFVHGNKSGFDFLEKGSTSRIRRQFWPDHLTNKGNLSGTVVGKPFLHLQDEGWIELWTRHEPVADFINRVLVNDVGDYAMQDYQYTYVSLGGGDLERIGPEGFDVTLETLGNRHQVIGSYRRQPQHKFDFGGPDRPYVFTPKEGFVDVLPDGCKRGVARWISTSGVIYGTATRERGGDTLFRRNPDGTIQTVDLRQAFNDEIDGYTFRSAKVIDVNNRGWLVAEVTVRPRNITTCWGVQGRKVFVYFDDQQGFVNLQEAVDEAGLDLLIFDIVDLSDRESIVVRACRANEPSPGWPWTGVLLRPR